MGQLARPIGYACPTRQLLVEELQGGHDDWIQCPTLPEQVNQLHAQHPSFTIELFIRGEAAVRRRVLTGEGDLNEPELHDGNVYHSPTVFQLKAMLYHVGILTERGAEPSNLEPTEDIWTLRDAV